MKKFEAFADDPESIIKATQKALLTSMRDVASGLKKDIGGPGLTWDQLNYFFETFEKKSPTVINQKDPM